MKCAMRTIWEARMARTTWRYGEVVRAPQGSEQCTRNAASQNKKLKFNKKTVDFYKNIMYNISTKI